MNPCQGGYLHGSIPLSQLDQISFCHMEGGMLYRKKTHTTSSSDSGYERVPPEIIKPC